MCSRPAVPAISATSATCAAYQDITDDSNVDLGLSYARGHNTSGVVDGADVGRFMTDLFGVDATVRWRPLRRSIYHSFLGRSEVIWSRRNQPDGLQRAFGYYVSGDYQFARRWFAGARYDRSDRADDASLHDNGGSLLLTFWPSEFSQVRGQYRRTSTRRDRRPTSFCFSSSSRSARTARIRSDALTRKVFVKLIRSTVVLAAAALLWTDTRPRRSGQD